MSAATPTPRPSPLSLLVLAGVVAAGAERIASTFDGLFARYWWNDLCYFWSAGRMWREGVSPYSPGFIERANAIIPNPIIYSDFYYAPAIRPLTTLLALSPMDRTALVFFTANVFLIAISCALLADVVCRLNRAFDRRLVLAAFLLFALVLSRHPLVVASIGQITIFLTAAFSAHLYALASGRLKLIPFSLAILLIKPQFGIGLFVLTMIDRRTRPHAFAGAAIYALLTAYGLSTYPLGSLFGFLANIASYGEVARGVSPAHSSGLAFLIEAAGLHVPVAATLILLAAAPLLLRLRAPSARPELLAIAVMTWSVFAAPNHIEDFTLLVPALALAFVPGPAARAATIAGALILLGRSEELVAALEFDARRTHAFVRAAINTTALAALLAAALSAAGIFGRPWRTTKAASGAAHAARAART